MDVEATILNVAIATHFGGAERASRGQVEGSADYAGMAMSADLGFHLAPAMMLLLLAIKNLGPCKSWR